jgi:hypothetical protein
VDALEQPSSPPTSATLPTYYSSPHHQVQGAIGSREGTGDGGSVPSVQVEGFGGSSPSANTLDEPVWATVKRDLLRVLGNVKVRHQC